MFGTILKATFRSFKKGVTYCRSILVTKVMKLLAFIFEQPSYLITCFLTAVRHEVNNLESSVVVQELELAINLHEASMRAYFSGLSLR